MSATKAVKQAMPRRTSAVLYLIQYLVITGALFVFGFVLFPWVEPADKTQETLTLSGNGGILIDGSANALSPRMQAALDYVTRRYRVSQDALQPLFELTQVIGHERSIDPLLILAIIGIESRFNPFAESPMGAQGLMQIIPRFHMDKLPSGAGEKPFLNPEINLRVGVQILEDAIQRRGGIVAGLQYYAGASDASGHYASRVLAEKQRLEQAVARSTGADV